MKAKACVGYWVLAELFCKPLVAAAATFNANVSEEAHRLAFPNPSQFNSWQRFPSFTHGPYTFSGASDPTVLMDDDSIAVYMKTLVNKKLRPKPIHQEISAKGGVRGYDGLDGSVKVVFAWLVEDQLAFTYGQCAEVIDYLATWLDAQRQLKYHPVLVNIERGNALRIGVGVTLEEGEEVDLMPDINLFMIGDLYSARKLPPDDVRAVLYAAESEDDWHESQSQPSLVPDHTVQSYTRGKVHLEIRFKAPQGHDWPEFSYKDLSIMMQELERFFLRRGVYAAFYGILSVGKYEHNFKDVGFLKIELGSFGFNEDFSNVSNTTLNGTVNVLI